jgi:uncharacterized Zn-binding protein involved in type VI secretion
MVMPGIARLGDADTGHGCWPSRSNVAGSSNVFCNGKPLHRQGDAWAPHTCPTIPETHSSVLGAGSSTVFVNEVSVGRIGDPVACGSVVSTGSGNVFAGG